ncbi:MAG: lamin tail domain-containing protein [Gammaproteobacteria bacterium]
MMRRWVTGALLLSAACTAHAAGNVVISQVYGGGGNSNAPYQNDFVELFNRSAGTVSLAGWSVQYASATGTGNFSGNGVIALSGSLAPGQRYLVKLASNGAVGALLPTADATLAGLNISGASGKVVLANTATGLACNGGSSPCSAPQLAQIVDLVGYGGANFFENAPTALLTNTTAALRLNGGCTDTDINSADFSTGAPNPRNSSAALSPCGGPSNAPVMPSCPASLPVILGTEGVANLGANDADGMVASAAITSTPVAGISLGAVFPGTPLTTQLLVSSSTAAGNYPRDGDVRERGRCSANRIVHDRRECRAPGGGHAHS